MGDNDNNMINKLPKRKILYKPIIFIHIYLFIILMLYVFGPYDWKTENPFLFYLYILIIEIILHVGYIKTINKKYNKYLFNEYIKPDYLIVNNRSIIKYLNMFVVINTILIGIYSIRIIGLSSLSLTKILLYLQNGILEPDKLYYAKFTLVSNFGGQYFASIMTLLSPFTWFIIPLSIFYFKKITMLNKLLTIIAVFLKSLGQFQPELIK